ncbi:MAG: hypothetical protein ABIJ16_03490, partial [Bacteroidota bacterium]
VIITDIQHSPYISRLSFIDPDGVEVRNYDLANNIPDGIYEFYTDDTFKMLYMKGTITGGKKEGQWFFYNPEGLLLMVTNYLSGEKNGEEKLYYRDGSPMEERNYNIGILDGKRTTYRPDGSVGEEYYFENGIIKK